MRILPQGQKPPPGLSGTWANRIECFNNAGPAGAAAGPLTVNPIGQMVPYGASLAGLDRQGSSNVGGQNCAPMRLTQAPAMLAAALLEESSTSDSFCDCGDPEGGSGTTCGRGPSGSDNNMVTCSLNAAICWFRHVFPGLRFCIDCSCHLGQGPGGR